MRGSINRSQTDRRMLFQIILLTLAAVVLYAAPATLAQNSREQVEGVQNFGRVTKRYFRGGAVTPTGIESLAALGVRTIVDLRDTPNADEPVVSQRNGIKYVNFPMTGHETPDDKAVNEILSMIKSAKEPVYVHCSAGKHRAGTIAALYRMGIQGWTKEQAWAEQQSYGFGTPEEHPELYAYVYSSKAGRDVLNRPTAAEENAQSKSSSKEKKKKDKLAKAKKDDDDDDDDDDATEKARREKKDKKKDTSRSAAIIETKADGRVKETPAAKAPLSPAARTGGLSAEAGYITVAEAIKRAQAEGGSGNVLKVDLEWDPARSVVTWDVTFSSGNEYEIEATTGKLLDTKPKPPAKLAVLLPLELDNHRLLTFQEIIRKAETNRGQSVMEMELKRIKGRSETVYEVVLADGSTLFYDAATGSAVNGI